MWMAAGFSFDRFGTLAGVSFSMTSSLAASMSTGSSIMTTDRYGLALFDTIFSRLTRDLVPSNTILQLCFFSNIGMTVGSMNALWLAAPPITISLAWLRAIAGNPSEEAATTPPVPARNVRRVMRDPVIVCSPFAFRLGFSTSIAAHAARAETVGDVHRDRRAVGRVMLHGRVESRAGRGAPALSREHLLERGKAEQHVRALGGIAHGPDAPDASLERPERRADLEAEVLDQLAADAQLIDTVRHQHRSYDG